MSPLDHQTLKDIVFLPSNKMRMCYESYRIAKNYPILQVIAYLDPVDTQKPESDLSKSESEIVKISESARPIMKEMEVDVPLFWD